MISSLTLVVVRTKEAKCGGVICPNEPCHSSVDGSASRKSTASPVISSNLGNAGRHQ